MNLKLCAELLVFGLAAQSMYCVNSGEQLYLSISGHDYPKARQLINEGADVNWEVPYGKTTPLMLAAFNRDDIEIIRILLNKKANVNASDANGLTALGYLASSQLAPVENFQAIASILLNAGANINAKDKLGSTPLHLVAEAGFINEVRYLLDHGADPSIKRKDGKFPVDLVPENNVQLRQLLLSVTHRKHYKK